MTRHERTSSRPPEENPGGRTSTTADDVEAAQELGELQDRYQRLAADFDNYRKRMVRDALKSSEAQKEGLLREILSVGDNLQRALATHASATAEQLRAGIEMTHQQFKALLERHGVSAESGVGAAFDPHRHEAIGSRVVPGAPDHTVVEVVQPGYRRGDTVLRPAQVIINDLEVADPDADGSGV